MTTKNKNRSKAKAKRQGVKALRAGNNPNTYPRKDGKVADGWRVVYGETRPAWEGIFPTKREANAFAKKHRGFGDVIFSIAKTVPGEPPQSMTAAIEAADAKAYRAKGGT